MQDHFPTVRVAVVQAAPVIFDREATAEKAVRLVQETAQMGAQVVLFPEAFIPAYPRGLSFDTVVGQRKTRGRDLWQRYYENAVPVPGPTTQNLSQAAFDAGIYLVMGVVERDAGTLYCTTLYFGPDGSLIGKHRKLKPTGAERLIWGEGDGSTLTVVDTEYGVIGGLICWENYMPLARMAMYQKSVDLYMAPTADSRDTWQATLRHIACEGRCFVLGCNQFIKKDMYPPDLPGIQDLADQLEVMCRGGSAIINPLGEVIAGPLYGEEGILYADLDMTEVARSKFDFDVVGHYARPDVFRLVVNEEQIMPEEPQKSTVEEIRQRFDKDVERFSHLKTGQTTIVDSALMMELTVQAAAGIMPQASHLLDVGCGAGNFTLKLLQLLPDVNVTLVDLSRPMLDRAVERISTVSKGVITPMQGDIRELDFEPSQFDIILAAAVLHHLRDDSEWHSVFTRFYNVLKPGGSVWIIDMIEHSVPAVSAQMWQCYGEILKSLKDEAYRDQVFGYIKREDSPRSLLYQVNLLQQVGFETVEILHKNNCFAAFGAVK